MRKVLIWTTRTTCDFNCRYCYYTQEKRENNKIKNLDQVLTILDSIQPDVVYLSGEPTLYKNLVTVINSFRTKGIKVVLTTHGARFTKEYSKVILATGLEAILISLDGPTKEINNISRQDFEKVVLGIDNIVETRKESGYNLNLGITYVVHAKNLHEIENTINFAIAKGVNYFHFQPVSLSKNFGNADLILDNEMYSKMIEIGKNISDKYSDRIKISSSEYIASLESVFFEKEFKHSCHGGEKLFFLDENLSLRTCPTPVVNPTSFNLNGAEVINACKPSINCVSMTELIRSSFP